MKNKTAFIKTFPVTWVFTIVVGAIVWLTVGKIWGVSFILGSVVSMMMMSMLYKTSKNILQEGNTNAQKAITVNYIIRYLFYAVILVISALLDNIEVLGVAIGLFSFKICLYFSLFLEKRGDKQ